MSARLLVRCQRRQYDGDRALCHQCGQYGSPLYDFYVEDEDGDSLLAMGCSACAIRYGRATAGDMLLAVADDNVIAGLMKIAKPRKTP